MNYFLSFNTITCPTPNSMHLRIYTEEQVPLVLYAFVVCCHLALCCTQLRCYCHLLLLLFLKYFRIVIVKIATFPLQFGGPTMSARSSSSAMAASSSAGDVPRPPPRRRAASVAGQQQTQQRLDYNNGHAPRRSLAAVVSRPDNQIERQGQRVGLGFSKCTYLALFIWYFHSQSNRNRPYD